jgi:hypothetical protein
MPVIQREVTIALTSVTDNLLSGSAFEFARQNSLVTMGVTQAAAGMFATINSGADVVAEEFSPAIQTRFPIIPDEMYYTDIAVTGDRLVIRVRNPTAGAIIARTIVQVSPLG